MNSMVESGSVEWSTSGKYTAAVSPVPTASTRRRPTGRPRSSARSAAIRHASTGTRLPTRIGMTWATAKVGPNSFIGMAARNDGRGSQTSKAARGSCKGGVW